MRLGAILIAFAATVAVACAPEPDEQEHTEEVGAALVASRVSGDRIETTVRADAASDTLSFVFDKRASTVRIVPKFGAARVVPLAERLESAEAATRFVSAPLAHGQDTARALRADGAPLEPKVFEPPPPKCTNPCYDACDKRFPDPALNTACRFGCSQGCSR